MKKGDIVKWTDYTGKSPVSFVGIVINKNLTTDALEVICSKGITQWLSWQCTLLYDSTTGE